MADPRKLKEKATEAFQKGKFVKAAEAYAEYCEADPKDLQARLRMGDAWSKGGKKEKAIEAYTWAAEGFAKDGFLPRAIAASKLILELDPSHQGVQKMLAGLYARKTTAPLASGAARPLSLKVETKVDVQTTAAGFSNRADAIDLEAPVATKPAPGPVQPEPPSPFNRKDAIDLPEYEVPGMEVGPASGSASVPMAAKGPSPMRREDAIEIVEEDTGRKGPAALAETVIELDVSVTGSQPEAPPPAARPSAPEISLEIEVPIMAPGAAVTVYELDADDIVESTTSGELELTDVAEPEPPAKPRLEVISDQPPPAPKPVLEVIEEPKQAEPSFELTIEQSGSFKKLERKEPPPGEVSASFELTEVVEPSAFTPDPAPSAPPMFTMSPLPEAPGEKSGAFNTPPGMKPRKAATEAATPPAEPRIWLPGNFAPPAIAEAVAPPPPVAVAPAAPVAANLTDLERGLQIFSSFDADDFKPVKAAAPLPAPELKPTRRTFTELELEGDSLLHAVETAAAVGVEQRGETAGQGGEEAMDMPDDAKPEPGELPKIPLFSDLPPDAFIALFERCPLKRVEPGEIVIQQGSLGDSFYVICAGSVRVFRMDGEQRREIATLEEGAFFGEMALLSGAARTASVEAATEDTQLLEISAPILTDLSHRYPQVASALKKFCRQRLLSNLMGSATLFQPFSRQDRRELVQRFKARDVSKGDVLIREGQRSDGMYVILSGEVEVRVGQSQVASLKEGDVFGEMSLLTKSNATATVAASKRTSLLRLPREDFDHLIMSHPQVLVLVSELTDSRAKQNAALDSHRPPSGDAAPMV